MAESQNAVTKLVQKSLEATPYACKSLIPLSGGSSNYLYHGTLMETLPDGTTIVIIKHTEPHLFSNKDFKLTTTRTVSCCNLFYTQVKQSITDFYLSL